eukprot:gb/GEZN01010001.1/.p1 GENE.gb/GEZN01010001.1/~~gb/GEZN01010001.1/.p1  ORF type:complete len:364 (+),score=11.99 gb/GEZN01010001.1/:67-1158(+)
MLAFFLLSAVLEAAASQYTGGQVFNKSPQAKFRSMLSASLLSAQTATHHVMSPEEDVPSVQTAKIYSDMVNQGSGSQNVNPESQAAVSWEPHSLLTLSEKIGICVSNTMWNNNFGKKCTDYTTQGWCLNGVPVKGLNFPTPDGSAAGSVYNFPEQYCCECSGGPVAFLGDSITYYWDKVGGYLPWPNALKFGVPGQTTVFILQRVDSVIATNPRAVVIFAGTNDMYGGIPTADKVNTAMANIKSMVNSFKTKLPSVKIFVCKLLPTIPNNINVGDIINAISMFNSKCDTDFSFDPRVTVIDTWKAFADPSGNPQSADFHDNMLKVVEPGWTVASPDWVHLSKAGYTKLANLVFTTLSGKLVQY